MQSKRCGGEEGGERCTAGDAFCHGVEVASSCLAEEVCEACRSRAVRVRRIHCGQGESILGQEEERRLLSSGVLQDWFVDWGTEMGQGQHRQV